MTPFFLKKNISASPHSAMLRKRDVANVSSKRRRVLSVARDGSELVDESRNACEFREARAAYDAKVYEEKMVSAGGERWRARRRTKKKYTFKFY